MIDALQSLVRPLSTLALVGALIWGFYAGKVSDEAFLSVVSIVVGFWYSSRQTPPTTTGGSQ